MDPPRPGDAPLSRRNPRVVAATRLHRRRERYAAGRFLAEGERAVEAALAHRPDLVQEVFLTPDAAGRHPGLVAAAGGAGVPVSTVTQAAAGALAGTVTPAGVTAVCTLPDVPLADAVHRRPALVAVLVGVADPGNAGTVLRTADAAGAGVVVLAGDLTRGAVDPYNGKCVRASAGSLFHLPVVRAEDPRAVVASLRAAGLRVLAADPGGEVRLPALPDPGAPTAWLFGSEAHGLPAPVAAAADARVAVPIHGRAESLNLAAAAAICLYHSAGAQQQQREESDAGSPGG